MVRKKADNNLATKNDVKELNKKIDNSVERLNKKIDNNTKRLEMAIELAITDSERRLKEEIRETNKQTRFLQNKILEKLDEVLNTMDKFESHKIMLAQRVDNQEEKIEEHEGRITELEKQIPVSV